MGKVVLCLGHLRSAHPFPLPVPLAFSDALYLLGSQAVFLKPAVLRHDAVQLTDSTHCAVTLSIIPTFRGTNSREIGRDWEHIPRDTK